MTQRDWELELQGSWSMDAVLTVVVNWVLYQALEQGFLPAAETIWGLVMAPGKKLWIQVEAEWLARRPWEGRSHFAVCPEEKVC